MDHKHRIERGVAERLGDHELAPVEIFGADTVGLALQRGALDGAIFHGDGVSFELSSARILRRPGAGPGSSERDWAVLVDYTCTPHADVSAPAKITWEMFDPMWLLPIDPREAVQSRFAALTPRPEPEDLRHGLRSALQPAIRSGTLPAWVANDLLNASRKRSPSWAAVETDQVRAYLYCDSIDLAPGGPFELSVPATQRIEVHADGEIVTTSQQLYLGRLYPESFLAPPPTSEAALDKFFADLYARYTKKLAALGKKIAKVPPETWMPHDLTPKPSPMSLLQKQLKLKSALESSQ